MELVAKGGGGAARTGGQVRAEGAESGGVGAVAPGGRAEVEVGGEGGGLATEVE